MLPEMALFSTDLKYLSTPCKLFFNQRYIRPGGGVLLQFLQQSGLHVGHQDCLPLEDQVRILEPAQHGFGTRNGEQVRVVVEEFNHGLGNRGIFDQIGRHVF